MAQSRTEGHASFFTGLHSNVENSGFRKANSSLVTMGASLWLLMWLLQMKFTQGRGNMMVNVQGWGKKRGVA